MLAEMFVSIVLPARLPAPQDLTSIDVQLVRVDPGHCIFQDHRTDSRDLSKLGLLGDSAVRPATWQLTIAPKTTALFRAGPIVVCPNELLK